MSGQAVAAVERRRRNREGSGTPTARASMPVPAQERIPMPHRDRLERRFGRPLAGIPVYSGPQVARALADHGAVAATQDGCIFLADRAASLPVVVHEVVHVLQPLLRRPGIPVLEPADSAAEREASRVAAAVTSQAPVSAPSLDEPLPEGSLALLRESPGTIDEQPISLDGGLPVPIPVPRPAPTPSTAGATPVPPIPASPLPARSTVGTTQGVAPPAPLPEAATPPPETAALAGLTAEPGAAGQQGAQAQPQQAMAQQAAAQAAMAEATSSGVLLHAYATAPPTAKAAQAAMLAAQVGLMADGEAASVQSDVPDLHAHLDAGAPPSGADTVLAPAPHAVELVPPQAGPTPLPQVDVPDAVGEFRPVQDVSAPFNWLTTAEPAVLADQIGESLSDVPVTDPGVPRSTGPVPAIPLEGDSDPALLATAQTDAQTQADTARADGAQAVLDGPGPERVQPEGVDVGYPLGELAVTPLAVPAGPAEAAALDTPQAYLAMNLPPEVQASFDAQQQTAMEQSAAGAADQVDQAAAARDEAKQAAVSDAQTGLAELNGTAGGQQAQAVADARQSIQAARRDTLDKQQQEVDRVATDADTQRASQEQEIDARVTQDHQAIESEYNQAQSSIDTKVTEGEQKAAQEKAAAEKAAEEESWWDRAVNFVKDALNALVDAIGAIFDAIRDALNAILDAVKAAALAIIDAAASFVKGAIAAFAAVLKAAVEGLLGEIFPELAKALTDAIDAAAEAATKAVDAVADTLKAGVNALVESLRAGLMAVINAYQSAITLAVGLVTAAITGDWALLARKVLEAVLQLVGVAPESFYAFVGRAQETWKIIIDAPGAFLGHVVDAVTGGVQRFADNFGTHLQAGIIGWLTGALGSAGITLPQTFDLMGVLDLARQILGLTWDALRAKAVKLIGEQNVQRLQLVYDFIQTLVTEGWAALWNKIMDSVATLKDVVFDAIKSYLVEKIIVAAVTKLVSLFSPVGAIVQLVLTAWNLYTFLRDQLSRIAEVVSTVVTAIGDIARGILDGAIAAVEGVLARLLPIAIDLLARLLSLGNVAEKVREIIENIRATVDRAIDAIIEKVANAFRGGSGAAGATAAPAGAEVAAGTAVPGAAEGEAPLVETFTLAGEEHTLRAVVDGGPVEPEMASGQFRGLASRITGLVKELTPIYLDPTGAKYVGTQQALQLRDKLVVLQNTAGALVTDLAKAAAPPGADDATRRRAARAERTVVQNGFAQLRKLVTELKLPEATAQVIHPGHGPKAGGKATFERQTWFQVNPLSVDSLDKGGPADDAVPGIGVLRGYDRGHLVAKSLGGPGTSDNLVPMSKSANTERVGIQSTEESLRYALRQMAARPADYRPPENPPYVFDYTVTARYVSREPADLQADLKSHGLTDSTMGQALFELAQSADEPRTTPTDAALLTAVGRGAAPDPVLAANVRRRLAYFFHPSEIRPSIQVVQEPAYDKVPITVGGSVPTNLGVDVLWHG